MSDQSAQLARAASAAACSVLTQGGSSLIGAGAWSLAAGGAGLVPLTLGTMSVFAANYAGCWDSNAPATSPTTPLGSQGQCERVTGGCATRWEKLDDGPWVQVGEDCYFIENVCSPAGTNEQGVQMYERRGTLCTGETFEVPPFASIQRIQEKLVPCDGATCDQTGPGPLPTIDPIEYTDPVTNCTLNVSFKGFAAFPGDEIRAVYKIEPAASTRASGGVITNCNFEPTIYVPNPGGGGDGGGDDPVGPWLPDWDDWDPSGGGTPPWLPWVTGAVGGLVGDLIGDAIQEAFKQPVPQYRYTFRAACDYKQDGSYEDYTITLPEEPWEQRVLSMQEMQIDFLQQHLLWKTPTCGGGGQPVTGDPVTINWISDEPSPVSGTRLNKRFVYFDQNNSSLQATVDHWKDFVWQSGPVIVGLTGTPLGKPQVWAASEAEGKRVLEHAAQIAGVDLSNAEYQIGTPKDSRYGVPATMRVLKRKGVLGITSRQGPNGYPEGLSG